MNWTKTWKASVKPSKQRKYVRNAPAHVRSKLPVSHLSKDLKQKHKSRSLRVIKGDKVKVTRGQYKNKTGTVDRVDTKRMKVFITGIDFAKRDGSKSMYPIHPSNLLIQELNTNDKLRLGGEKKTVKGEKK